MRTASGALSRQTLEGLAVDEEPLRELTQAEYEELSARLGGEHRVNPKPESQISSGALPNAELALSQEAMDLGLKIWQLRKAGCSRLQILERLEIPLKVIDDCLREFESRVSMDATRTMEHYRVLDDERIEDLLKHWLPIATGGPIRIEKVRGGQVFSEADFDLPLKAGYFVLQAIERRLKIMAASRPEASKDGNGQTNVLVWLQSVLPSLQKDCRAGRRWCWRELGSEKRSRKARLTVQGTLARFKGLRTPLQQNGSRNDFSTNV